VAIPKRLSQVIQFVLFTGVGVLILYFVYKSQNEAYIAECALKGIPDSECSLLEKLKADFSGANYGWIALVILAFLMSNVIRAHRWLMLIHTLGRKGRLVNAFFTIMIGYFANMGLPRVGEIVRAGLFARYEAIGAEKVMGTIVVDRILDLISLLFAILLVIILQGNVLWDFFGNKIQDSILAEGWLYFLIGGGILLLVFIYRFRHVIKRWNLYLKIHHLVEGFRDGLRSLKRVERPWVLVLDTALIWLMYYLMMFLCFKAFEPTEHLRAMAGLMVFVFGGLGVVFPSPGGMGTFHAMVITALAIYGIHGDDAFSFANIEYFSVQLLGTILFGIIGLIILPIINKKANQNVPVDPAGTI
jgi:uncharacterized protein (TIRG00374 family)